MKQKTRVLLKISGEALMGETSFGLDIKTVNYIANEIKEVFINNYQICLIIGGGNIYWGIEGSSEGIDRSTSDYMGMLATVINALSMQSALEKINVTTRVQTAIRKDFLHGQKFAEWVGLENEGLMKKYGFDGSDQYRYARVF